MFHALILGYKGGIFKFLIKKMVGLAGLEPARPYGQQILSPILSKTHNTRKQNTTIKSIIYIQIIAVMFCGVCSLFAFECTTSTPWELLHYARARETVFELKKEGEDGLPNGLHSTLYIPPAVIWCA